LLHGASQSIDYIFLCGVYITVLHLLHTVHVCIFAHSVIVRHDWCMQYSYVVGGLWQGVHKHLRRPDACKLPS